jgi:predicted metal-dependent phosphoesterase TrpH
MADAKELLDYVEEHTDLDVLAITDHDDIAGSWQAREIWANGRYRFDFIVGIEVTAIEGHLLALFVEEPVPNLCPVEKVLEEVHQQGGVCVVPHPMSWLTRSLDRGSLLRIADMSRDGIHFDGIETANQSPAARLGLRRATDLNRERLNLAEVGGSDAHFLTVIGSAYTEFEGKTAEDLRESILARTTRGVNGLHPTIREIGLGQVLRQSFRGLMTTPRRMGLWPTTYSFVRRIFHLR